MQAILDHHQTGPDASMPEPLKRLVAALAKEVSFDASEIFDVHSLAHRISVEVQRILLDSGFGPEDVADEIEAFEQTILSNMSADAVTQEVCAFYSRFVSTVVGTPGGQADTISSKPHPVLVIGKTLKTSGEARIGISILRQSPSYAAFRTQKIWNKPISELKYLLDNAPCSIPGCHWYMILLRIFRFSSPDSMVSGSTIAADALRNFLCDFVFCVPREDFSPSHNGSTGKANNGQKVLRKNVKHALPDNLSHVADFTKTEWKVFSHYFGYRGDGYDRCDPASYDLREGKSLQSIVGILGKGAYTTVFTPFKKALAKCANGKTHEPIPEIDNDRSLPTNHVHPDIEQNTKKLTPEAIPDLTRFHTLTLEQAFVFCLYYGYKGGDLDFMDPGSYTKKKRLDYARIAEIMGVKYMRVFFQLRGALQKLGAFSSANRRSRRKKWTTFDVPQIAPLPLPVAETPPAPADPAVIELPIETPAPPLPAAPKPQPITRIRPSHPDIPEDIQEYGALVAWIKDPAQVSVLRSFQYLARSFAGRSIAETQDFHITGRFTVRSIEWSVLLLAKHLEPKRPLSDFLLQIHTVPSQKPVSPLPSYPTSRIIPTPPEKRDPAPSQTEIIPVPLISSLAPDQTPALPTRVLQKLSTGAEIPQCESHADFIAWASEQQDIVASLSTFLLEATQKSGGKAPDDMKILAGFREGSDERRVLMLGKKTRPGTTFLQMLLDICGITLSAEPAAAPEPEEMDIDMRYLTALENIQKNDSWMETLHTICDDYTGGKYDQTLRLYELLRDNIDDDDMVDLWNALLETNQLRTTCMAQEGKAKISVFALIFEICGKNVTDADLIALYKTEYAWDTRLGELLVPIVTTETINGFLGINDMAVLIDRLRTIRLRVPLGKTKWMAWQERMASETDAYEFLEKLMVRQHKGSNYIKPNLKELKATIRHIRFPTENVE